MGTYKESQVISKKLPEKSYSETRDEIWKAEGGGGNTAKQYCNSEP